MIRKPIFAVSLLLTCSQCAPTSAQDEAPGKVKGVEIPNAYPELPEIDFKRTSVSLEKVADYLKKADYPKSVKISCYAIFKTESASGRMGINNNYIGYQADGSRVHEEWTKYFVGTVIRNERMTGKARRFLAFAKWEDCVEILLMRIEERGLFVGGHAKQYAKMKIKSDEDWPVAYYRGWVLGDSKAEVPEKDMNYYLKLYSDAKKVFE